MPQVLSAFAGMFLSEIVPPPHSIVAAGHTAAYALPHAVSKPGTIKHLALIAPTWRGPLQGRLARLQPNKGLA
jgi:hypothetical protein